MTLIELMATLTLAMLLLGFVTQSYLAAEKQARWTLSLTNLVNRAERASHLISMEIHSAGYIGCPRLTADFPLSSSIGASITPSSRLTGTDSSLTVKHASQHMATLVENMEDASVLYVSRDAHLTAGEPVLISDCFHAEIVQIGKVYEGSHYQRMTVMRPLQHLFSKGAEVSRFEINTFHVAKTSRIETDGSPVYALYLQDIHSRRTELVDGVNALHPSYLIQQGSLLSYVSASQVRDWSAVRGVSVKLVLKQNQLQKNWYIYAGLPQ